MSIMFSSPAAKVVTTKPTPCLCAQFAECFGSSLVEGWIPTEEEARQLKAEADSKCGWCEGTGIEPHPVKNLTEVDLCNSNAYAVLSALGLEVTPLGEIEVSDLLRRLLRALNTQDLSLYERPSEVLEVGQRVSQDGVVELFPAGRVYIAGLTEEGLKSRLTRLQAMVLEHRNAGAEIITWG